MNNEEFWNEICGTQAFKSLGLTKINKKSLDVFDTWYMDDMYPYLYKYLNLPNLRNKTVLEIGLGFGTVGQKLFLKAKKYIGLDYSKNPVELMRYRIKMRGKESKARAIKGDAKNLPFKNKTFDYVVSIGCLHHTGDIQKCINEIFRVLDDGGKALIMLYNKHSWRMIFQNPYDYFKKQIKSRIHYEEFIRGTYDKDSKGNVAPITIYSSFFDVKRYFTSYSKISIQLENFDDIYISFVGIGIQRKKLLSNIAKVLGLDFYILAEK